MTATRAVHGLAVLAILAGVGVALALRFALAGEAERLSRPRQPSLFYGSAGSVALGAPHVFAVAHNAGDTSAAAQDAVASGARVVEIDVVSLHGRLEAAHDRPLPAVGVLRLKAPGIEEIWRIAARAKTIELDLKQTSVLALEPLVAFLRAHRGHEVFVSTRSVVALRTLRDRTPWVRRFLSVANKVSVLRVRLDPRLRRLVQGVSVRQDLLDAETAHWLKAEKLVVLAWVVDDARRASELAGYGVDGIATDNLTLLERLTSLERGRPR